MQRKLSEETKEKNRIRSKEYRDVDHIIPLASTTNEDELLKLNHYTNLQPLCSYHNRFIKKDNY